MTDSHLTQSELTNLITERIAKILGRSNPDEILDCSGDEIARMFEKVWLAGYDEIGIIMEMEDVLDKPFPEGLELPPLGLHGMFFWRNPGAKTFKEWCEDVAAVVYPELHK